MKHAVLNPMASSDVALAAITLGIFNYHVPSGPQVYTFDDMPGLFLVYGQLDWERHWVTTTEAAELWLMLHLPAGYAPEEVDPSAYPELEKYLYD